MEKETFDQSKEPVSCPYVLILYESKDKDIYVYIYFRQLSKIDRTSFKLEKTCLPRCIYVPI